MTSDDTEQLTEWPHQRQPHYLLRDDHRDLTVMIITAKEHHVEIERITGCPTLPIHWPRSIANCIRADQETIAERYSTLYSNPPYWRPTKWLSPSSRPPKPYQMSNQAIARSPNAIYKAASQEQMQSSITPIMTTYYNAYMLDPDQWYTTYARCNLRQFCHLSVVPASAIYESLIRSQERKVHHCPNAKPYPCDGQLCHRGYPGQLRSRLMPRIQCVQVHRRDGRELMNRNQQTKPNPNQITFRRTN
jgi:hypothetical protein